MYPFYAEFILAGKHCVSCLKNQDDVSNDSEQGVVRSVIEAMNYAEELYEIGNLDDYLLNEVKAFGQDLLLICACCDKKIPRVNNKVLREVVQCVMKGRTELLKRKFAQRKIDKLNPEKNRGSLLIFKRP
jgi:hypothetical protein